MTKYQKFVVGLLAFLQFTLVLDFMILSPLGAFLMPDLQINPAQFGLVVSAYAFSAGLSGFLAAGFADRFDRKKLLLFFYTGFLVGTLLCGLARSYEFLLVARIVTGLFGGVIGSVVFAITTDLFPFEMRGRVMGVVQTSFAASQVLGIPAGLYFANHWGWNSPFLLIVGVGVLVGLIIVAKLQPINAHLNLHPDRSALHHLWQTVTTPRYVQGFATTALMAIGGFMMMPFGSAFTMNNMGVSAIDLPLVYMVTGLGSILVGPLVGRLSDKFGKFRMFFIGCVVTMITVPIYAHMGVSSLGLVMLINVVMFAGIFTRIIASTALISALPKTQDRGAYMSVGSSIQQVAGGIASAIAGLIVVQGEGGRIEHFDTVGWVVAGTTLITLTMMYFVNIYITGQLAESAANKPQGASNV